MFLLVCSPICGSFFEGGGFGLTCVPAGTGADHLGIPLKCFSKGVRSRLILFLYGRFLFGFALRLLRLS